MSREPFFAKYIRAAERRQRAEEAEDVEEVTELSFAQDSAAWFALRRVDDCAE
ncbi:hypothetical protein [Nocardia sp. NPDC057440]|uniref:hypothetical protein n=1 Tax=Nocardia sp. NPDC057440 TaxID=3346134 RepID=UPI00366A608E